MIDNGSFRLSCGLFADLVGYNRQLLADLRAGAVTAGQGVHLAALIADDSC